VHRTFFAASAAFVIGVGVALSAPLVASADTVVGTYPHPGSGFAAPDTVVVSPDGATVYAVDGAAEVLSIDAETGVSTAIPIPIPTPAPVAYRSNAVAISPDGSTLYVALSRGVTAVGAQDDIVAIARATGVVSAPLRLGSNLTSGLAVSPDGAHVYATLGNSPSQINVINAATLTIERTISAPSQPRTVLVSPDGSRLYVGHLTSPAASASPIRVYDAATGAQLPDIATSGTAPTTTTAGTALSGDGTTLYVTHNAAGTLDIIDVATGAVTTVSVGAVPRAVALTPDGTRAYVATSGGVVIVDLATNTVATTLTAGTTPVDVTISPDGRFAWVMNQGGPTISKLAIDTPPAITTPSVPNGSLDGHPYSAAIATTGTPTPTLSVSGDLPPGLTFDPATGDISGTPTTAGDFTFTITAASTVSGIAMTATRSYTISIAAAPALLAESGLDAMPVLLIGGSVALLGLAALLMAGVLRRRQSAVEAGATD
jgi:YVTN family beta-propeller protein